MRNSPGSFLGTIRGAETHVAQLFRYTSPAASSSLTCVFSLSSWAGGYHHIPHLTGTVPGLIRTRRGSTLISSSSLISRLNASQSFTGEVTCSRG
ncbi:hypothetical protein H257_18768, partial [Aphanomyces astaci]